MSDDLETRGLTVTVKNDVCLPLALFSLREIFLKQQQTAVVLPSPCNYCILAIVLEAVPQRLEFGHIQLQFSIFDPYKQIFLWTHSKINFSFVLPVFTNTVPSTMLFLRLLVVRIAAQGRN